nr:hypothetical protein [Tanacetum cinerariifolium]
MVRSMMSQTTLPKFFWDYVIKFVARILNMFPTKKFDKTPYEIWHGQAPKLSYLKVWGCEAFFKRDTLIKPDKLEPRAFKCIFVGYPNETMRYSFYYPSENKVFVARNAEFFENDIINQEASGKDDQEINEPQSDINPIRRFTRTRCAPDRMCLYIDAEEHDLGDLDAIHKRQRSLGVDLPPNSKTVGHKWLFKKKIDMDRAVHTYKAHLVAKGFTQTPGIDYEETSSLVADIRAIRILIAIYAFMTMRFGKWMSKLPSLMEFSMKRYTWSNKKVLLARNFQTEYASSSVPFKDLSKHLGNNPGEVQSTAVKNIMKYLRNTKDMFLIYEDDTKRELKVSCYTDAGYLTDDDFMESQTGYVFVLNGGAVDWKSTKQSIFATSSTNADYIADFDASKEAVWIQKFIFGLGVVPTIEEPINMYCDNTGVIAIANDHGVTKGARHFRAKV